MPKGDPEYKVYKENFDRMLEYYQERFDKIPDELHYEIFCEINDRITDFINIITKNFCELPDFLAFIFDILRKLNPLTVVSESES